MGECQFAGMPRRANDVLYEHKMPELLELRTSKYPKQRYASQNLSNSMQAAILDHTIGSDIENSSFALMYQLLSKLQPLHPLWAKANEVLPHVHHTVIEQHLQTGTCKGKVVMQKIFNGGNIPAEHAKNKFGAGLQKTAVLCRWAAVTAIPDAYAELFKFKDRAGGMSQKTQSSMRGWRRSCLCLPNRFPFTSMAFVWTGRRLAQWSLMLCTMYTCFARPAPRSCCTSSRTAIHIVCSGGSSGRRAVHH